MHWVAVDALDPYRTSWPREYSPLEPLALTALGFWKALPRPDRPCFVQLPAPVASFVDALPEVTDAGPVLAGDPLDLLVYAVELVEGDIAPAKALETIRMLAAR